LPALAAKPPESRNPKSKRPRLSVIEREIVRRRAEAERERVKRDAEAIRAKCGTLLGFVEEFWHILEPGRAFVKGWAIEAIALHLEAVSRGQIQYLLINVPPGMMKSLLVSVFWPAWEWSTRDAGLGFLTSSFSLDNVLRDNLKMRRLVESEKFQALFGDRVRQGGKWGEKRFETLASGVRAGRSFEKMTGGRGDRVIIDDPHDVDGGESDVQRPRAVKTFREAIPDRLNDMNKSAIVVIMQRLHSDDVSGTILKVGLPYVHLNLPMEFEAYREENGLRIDARCRTYLQKDIGPDGKPLEGATPFFVDPRTYDGELLFEERFPRNVVDGLKKAKGSYAYAGQYQQRPTPREGGMFKRAWFAGKIIPRSRVPAHSRRRVRTWDFAGTEAAVGASPDWTATLRGFSIGPDFYVDHGHRLQATPGTVQRTVVSFAETDPPGTTCRIPIDPAQAGVGQVESYVTAMKGHPLKPVSTVGRGDKTGRAQPAAVQAEYGHIYLVNSRELKDGVDSWIEPFLDELCAFPKAPNDDQVDCLSDLIVELAGMPSGAFETASAGRSEVLAIAERDSRYRFGDTAGSDPAPTSSGFGFGSVPSALGRLR
jgi:predicted phage terminase large subunit-like protein